MTTAYSAAGETRPGLAIGGGVLAGLLTLAVISSGVWLAGRSNTDPAIAAGDDAFGRAVAAADVEQGDCVDINASASASARFITRSCDDPHRAEVMAKVEHPDAGQNFPGGDALATWAIGLCESEADSYLGTALLETTLTTETVLPDAQAWGVGDGQTTCLVKKANATSLTAPVADAGADHLRGEQVSVSRLIDGDCFVPSEEVSSYELNSNSEVTLVSCDEAHNGVFFGRSALPEPIGALFPGESEVGAATSAQCGSLFEAHFGESSDGFNYRYWRPNQQSWDLDDRTILCAILDADPMTERFDPSEHQRFFDLEAGQCFNLSPEETSESLRLDDQVRVIDCGDAHLGEMIGSGNLDEAIGEPFPIDNGVLQLAGAECERLFLDFIGVSPYESELGNFPFWYPNEPGWDDGDRRYACAFLDEEPRSDSLQGAER